MCSELETLIVDNGRVVCKAGVTCDEAPRPVFLHHLLHVQSTCKWSLVNKTSSTFNCFRVTLRVSIRLNILWCGSLLLNNDEKGIVYYCGPNVSIPAGVEEIEVDTLLHSGWKVVVLPASLRRICEGVFTQCEILEVFTFESGSQLASVGKDAFALMGLKVITDSHTDDDVLHIEAFDAFVWLSKKWHLWETYLNWVTWGAASQLCSQLCWADLHHKTSTNFVLLNWSVAESGLVIGNLLTSPTRYVEITSPEPKSESTWFTHICIFKPYWISTRRMENNSSQSASLIESITNFILTVTQASHFSYVSGASFSPNPKTLPFYRLTQTFIVTANLDRSR